MQTSVSLPQHMACLWQGHITERLAVIDGIPSRDPHRGVMTSDSESSDSDQSADEINESANDPRDAQVGEEVGGGTLTPPTNVIDASAANMEVSPARSDNSMFDFEELEAKSPAQEGDDVRRIRLLSRNGHIDDTSIPDAVLTEEEVPDIDDPEFREIQDDDPEVDEGLHLGGRKEFRRQIVKQRVRYLEGRQRVPATESTVVLPRADEPGRGETPEKAIHSGDALKSRDRDLLVLPSDRKRTPVMSTKVGGRRLKMSRGITVDSGAADNVMPRKLLRKWMRVRPSKASKAGVHYVAANDARIPNEGEVDFEFQTKDGQKHSWLFQVAGVNKVLASVSSLVDTGHVVTFEKDDATGVDLSFITHKASGRSIKMRRERNVWTIDTFVDEDQDFSRQE